MHDDTWRSYRLKRRYGITLTEYNVLLKEQDGKCALCNKLPNGRWLDVDHDHTTNRVRGLLCYMCNQSLVSCHTLETAKKVVEYLSKFEPLAV